jgi:hypothetical protein
MAVPKSIRYSGNRKRKTTTVSADTTTRGTTRTPLGDVNGNRRTTTFTIDTTSAVGNDTECMDVEMTQGEPKRVCTDETASPDFELSIAITNLQLRDFVSELPFLIIKQCAKLIEMAGARLPVRRNRRREADVRRHQDIGIGSI